MVEEQTEQEGGWVDIVEVVVVDGSQEDVLMAIDVQKGLRGLWLGGREQGR